MENVHKDREKALQELLICFESSMPWFTRATSQVFRRNFLGKWALCGVVPKRVLMSLKVQKAKELKKSQWLTNRSWFKILKRQWRSKLTRTTASKIWRIAFSSSRWIRYLPTLRRCFRKACTMSKMEAPNFRLAHCGPLTQLLKRDHTLPITWLTTQSRLSKRTPMRAK